MIFSILAYGYILFITYCWGYLFFWLFSWHRTPHSDDFFDKVILGLIAISSVGAYFSIFFRINWEFQIFIFTSAFLIFVFLKPFKLPQKGSFYEIKNKNFALNILLSIVMLIIINATTLLPANPDTGIYHAQAIRWIETYPVVPGLANFHIRFGYNSSWLLTNAIFSFAFLDIQSFHLMTGFLFLIAGVYFFSGIQNILRENFGLSNLLKLGFLLGMVIFLLDQASSPGTDAPTAIITWIIITKFAEEKSSEVEKIDRKTFVYVALIVYSISLKLSSLPIILLFIPLLDPFFRKRDWKNVTIILFFALVLYLPHVIRSLIISGYPIFPGKTIDLIKVDWRLPETVVIKEPRLIHWFSSSPNSSLARFQSLSTAVWLSEWIADLIPRHKALLLALLSLPILMTMMLIFKSFRKFIRERKDIVYLCLVSEAGAVFWFVSAPAIRYGYGFTIGAVVLLGSILLKFFIENISFFKKAIRFLALPVSLTIVLMYSQFSWQFNTIKERFFFQADYPRWPTAPCEFKNFTTLCAQEYNSCWYDPFPCTVNGNSQVELRGKDYRDGFRYTQ